MCSQKRNLINLRGEQIIPGHGRVITSHSEPGRNEKGQETKLICISRIDTDMYIHLPILKTITAALVQRQLRFRTLCRVWPFPRSIKLLTSPCTVSYIDSHFIHATLSRPSELSYCIITVFIIYTYILTRETNQLH